MAKKINEKIFWIGVDNPKGRDFHGIHTPRGGSYNSYLIKGEKIALIDGTNAPYLDIYIESLKSICNLEKIDYIIINHAEPDHAGGLSEIIKICPNAKIVCSKKGEEIIRAAYMIKEEIITVEHEEELSLGSVTLRFLLDPMVHWPETMMTYAVEEKTLFSADMFGTEISHESLFVDEMVDFKEITRDYATLVIRPMATAARKAISFARELKLNYLCPSHGPVYRKDIKEIIDYYEKICTNPEEDKVVIIYFSIWHGTEKIATEIESLLSSKGCNVKCFNISKTNMITLMAEVLTSKVIVLGSLTILGGYHPIFEAFFPFMQLNCQKKKAFIFGTYGWSSCSVPKLKKKLSDLGHDVKGELDIRFGPKKEEDFEAIKIFTDKIKQILEE